MAVPPFSPSVSRQLKILAAGQKNTREGEFAHLLFTGEARNAVSLIIEGPTQFGIEQDDVLNDIFVRYNDIFVRSKEGEDRNPSIALNAAAKQVRRKYEGSRKEGKRFRPIEAPTEESAGNEPATREDQPYGGSAVEALQSHEAEEEISDIFREHGISPELREKFVRVFSFEKKAERSAELKQIARTTQSDVNDIYVLFDVYATLYRASRSKQNRVEMLRDIPSPREHEIHLKALSRLAR